MAKPYKSAALTAVHATVLGLAEAGVVAKQTVKAFDGMCLTPDEIRDVRLRERASRAVA